MISRQWKCILKEEAHDAYINFLNEVVFAAAKALPGFVEASILKREAEHGLEFMVTTLWEDLNSIKAFAGDDISLAMVPVAAQQMMISFDKTVTHYEVISWRQPLGKVVITPNKPFLIEAFRLPTKILNLWQDAIPFS